jgi:Family of unknown function (DUF6364)
MKTTLDITDNLLRKAKVAAAQQNTTLTRLIEEGLQLRLSTRRKAESATPLKLPLLKGKGGVVSGVDMLSNKALLERMESEH